MTKKGYQPIKKAVKATPPNTGSHVKMKECGYNWKSLDEAYWKGFDTAKEKMQKIQKIIIQLETENAELKEKVSYLEDNLRVARKDRENLQLDVAKGLKEGFLDGLKAGRPKWHKVADGDLPKENHFVLVLNKRTGYEIARHAPFEEYYLDNWVTIDNRSLIQTKNNQTVIAWCEIPKYTEE